MFAGLVVTGAVLAFALTPAFSQAGRMGPELQRMPPPGRPGPEFQRMPLPGWPGPDFEVGYAQAGRSGDAVVVVNGRPVINFQAGAVAGSPLSRAAAIAERLDYALELPPSPGNRIEARYLRDNWTVCAGDYVITIVTVGDGRELRSDAYSVARRWADNISAAMRPVMPPGRGWEWGYREYRDSRGGWGRHGFGDNR